MRLEDLKEEQKEEEGFSAMNVEAKRQILKGAKWESRISEEEKEVVKEER